MKRNGFTLWEIVGGVASLLVIAVIVWPMFARSRESGHPNSDGRCQNNLKQLALGFKQYLNDFDEHYPLVAVTRDVKPENFNAKPKTWTPYGWADALQPYIRNTQIYQCSLDKHEGQDNSGQSGFTDYWYNRRMTGISESKLLSSPQTIISGDGNDGTEVTDARYSLNSLPPLWLTTNGSPALRHPEKNPSGANYAFADGHVKALKPEQISNAPVAQYGYTFAPN
jgi:prepilin-type processing-associated H-X9-DG protein